MANDKGVNIYGCLYYYRKNGLSEPYSLRYGKTTLGSEGCDIRIKGEENVSCVLDSNVAGVTVLVNEYEDPNVLINGLSSKKYTVLHNGDHFEIGKKKFRYSNPVVNMDDIQNMQQTISNKMVLSNLRRRSEREPMSTSMTKCHPPTPIPQKRRFSTGSRIIKRKSIPKVSERNLVLPNRTSTPQSASKIRFSKRMSMARMNTLTSVKENELFDLPSPMNDSFSSPIEDKKSLLSVKRQSLKSSLFQNSTDNLKELDLNLTGNSCLSPAHTKSKIYSRNLSDHITTPENNISAIMVTPLDVSKRTNKSLSRSKVTLYSDFESESATPKSAIKSGIYRPIVEDVTPVSPLLRSSLRLSLMKKPSFTDRRSVNFNLSNSDKSIDEVFESSGGQDSSPKGLKRKRSVSDTSGRVLGKLAKSDFLLRSFEAQVNEEELSDDDSQILGVDPLSDSSFNLSNNQEVQHQSERESNILGNVSPNLSRSSRGVEKSFKKHNLLVSSVVDISKSEVDASNVSLNKSSRTSVKKTPQSSSMVGYLEITPIKGKSSDVIPRSLRESSESHLIFQNTSEAGSKTASQASNVSFQNICRSSRRSKSLGNIKESEITEVKMPSILHSELDDEHILSTSQSLSNISKNDHKKQVRTSGRTSRSSNAVFSPETSTQKNNFSQEISNRSAVSSRRSKRVSSLNRTDSASFRSNGKHIPESSNSTEESSQNGFRYSRSKSFVESKQASVLRKTKNSSIIASQSGDEDHFSSDKEEISSSSSNVSNASKNENSFQVRSISRGSRSSNTPFLQETSLKANSFDIEAPNHSSVTSRRSIRISSPSRATDINSSVEFSEKASYSDKKLSVVVVQSMLSSSRGSNKSFQGETNQSVRAAKQEKSLNTSKGADNSLKEHSTATLDTSMSLGHIVGNVSSRSNRYSKNTSRSNKSGVIGEDSILTSQSEDEDGFSTSNLVSDLSKNSNHIRNSSRKSPKKGSDARHHKHNDRIESSEKKKPGSSSTRKKSLLKDSSFVDVSNNTSMDQIPRHNSSHFSSYSLEETSTSGEEKSTKMQSENISRYARRNKSIGGSKKSVVLIETIDVSNPASDIEDEDQVGFNKEQNFDNVAANLSNNDYNKHVRAFGTRSRSSNTSSSLQQESSFQKVPNPSIINSRTSLRVSLLRQTLEDGSFPARNSNKSKASKLENSLNLSVQNVQNTSVKSQGETSTDTLDLSVFSQNSPEERTSRLSNTSSKASLQKLNSSQEVSDSSPLKSKNSTRRSSLSIWSKSPRKQSQSNSENEYDVISESPTSDPNVSKSSRKVTDFRMNELDKSRNKSSSSINNSIEIVVLDESSDVSLETISSSKSQRISRSHQKRSLYSNTSTMRANIKKSISSEILQVNDNFNMNSSVQSSIVTIPSHDSDIRESLDYSMAYAGVSSTPIASSRCTSINRIGVVPKIRSRSMHLVSKSLATRANANLIKGAILKASSSRRKSLSDLYVKALKNNGSRAMQIMAQSFNNSKLQRKSVSNSDSCVHGQNSLKLSKSVASAKSPFRSKSTVLSKSGSEKTLISSADSASDIIPAEKDSPFFNKAQNCSIDNQDIFGSSKSGRNLGESISISNEHEISPVKTVNTRKASRLNMSSNSSSSTITTTSTDCFTLLTNVPAKYSLVTSSRNNSMLKNSPANNSKVMQGPKTLRVYKSPKNDVTNISNVEKLLKSPENLSRKDLSKISRAEELLKTSHENDRTNITAAQLLLELPMKNLSRIEVLENGLSNIGDDKKLIRRSLKQKSPKNDLTDIGGIKRLLKTPKVVKSPKNDLTNIQGVRKLLKTPKEIKSPKNDLTNILGIKKILKTPKERKSPKNDLTNIPGVKKLLKTPKERKSPKNDLRNIRGVKKLLSTPKERKSPKNDLTNIRGIRKLLNTPKERKSPKNDLTNIFGVKKLLQSPKVRKSPKNDLTNVAGLKKLMTQVKQQKSPKNDLSNVKGVKKLMRTLRVPKSPKNDLSDLRGVKNLLRTPKDKTSDDTLGVSGIAFLFDDSNNRRFDELVGKSSLRTYSRSPKKSLIPKEEQSLHEDVPEVSKHVAEWVQQQMVLQSSCSPVNLQSETKTQWFEDAKTNTTITSRLRKRRGQEELKTEELKITSEIVRKPASTPISDTKRTRSKKEVVKNSDDDLVEGSTEKRTNNNKSRQQTKYTSNEKVENIEKHENSQTIGESGKNVNLGDVNLSRKRKLRNQGSEKDLHENEQVESVNKRSKHLKKGELEMNDVEDELVISTRTRRQIAKVEVNAVSDQNNFSKRNIATKNSRKVNTEKEHTEEGETETDLKMSSNQQENGTSSRTTRRRNRITKTDKKDEIVEEPNSHSSDMYTNEPRKQNGSRRKKPDRNNEKKENDSETKINYESREQQNETSKITRNRKKNMKTDKTFETARGSNPDNFDVGTNEQSNDEIKNVRATRSRKQKQEKTVDIFETYETTLEGTKEINQEKGELQIKETGGTKAKKSKKNDQKKINNDKKKTTSRNSEDFIEKITDVARTEKKELNIGSERQEESEKQNEKNEGRLTRRRIQNKKESDLNNKMENEEQKEIKPVRTRRQKNSKDGKESDSIDEGAHKEINVENKKKDRPIKREQTKQENHDVEEVTILPRNKTSSRKVQVKEEQNQDNEFETEEPKEEMKQFKTRNKNNLKEIVEPAKPRAKTKNLKTNKNDNAEGIPSPDEKHNSEKVETEIISSGRNTRANKGFNKKYNEKEWDTPNRTPNEKQKKVRINSVISYSKTPVWVEEDSPKRSKRRRKL